MFEFESLRIIGPRTFKSKFAYNLFGQGPARRRWVPTKFLGSPPGSSGTTRCCRWLSGRWNSRSSDLCQCTWTPGQMVTFVWYQRAGKWTLEGQNQGLDWKKNQKIWLSWKKSIWNFGTILLKYLNQFFGKSGTIIGVKYLNSKINFQGFKANRSNGIMGLESVINAQFSNFLDR